MEFVCLDVIVDGCHCWRRPMPGDDCISWAHNQERPIETWLLPGYAMGPFCMESQNSGSRVASEAEQQSRIKSTWLAVLLWSKACKSDPKPRGRHTIFMASGTTLQHSISL